MSVGPRATDVIHYTPDAPEAAGKQPAKGEVSYRLHFPLDDGRTVFVYMGQAGWDALCDLVARMERDEPSNG